MRNDHEICGAACRALEARGWTIVSRRSAIRYEAGFIAERGDEVLVGEAMAHFASRRVERPYRKPYIGHAPWHEMSHAIFRLMISLGWEKTARGCIVIPDEPFLVDWANVAAPGLLRCDIHLVVVDAEEAREVAIPPALQ